MDNLKSNTEKKANSSKKMMAQAVKFHQNGQLELASKSYQSVLKIDENNVDAIHLLGVIAYQIKSYNESRILIEQAISINPNQAIFYNNLGNTLKELKLYPEANDAYSKAIHLAPKYDKALLNQGVLQEILNNYESAKNHYLKSIEVNPKYLDAYNNLGGLCEKEGNLEQAIIYYKKTIEINPNYPQGYYNLGVIYRKKEEYKEALNYEFKALSINPKMAEAKNNIGVTYIALKNYKEAINFFEAAISDKNEYSDAHLNLGLCLFFEEKYDKAKFHFDEAVKHSDPKWHHVCNAMNYSIFMSMHMCEWQNINRDMTRLKDKKREYNNSGINLEPFSIQALPEHHDFHYECVKDKANQISRQALYQYKHDNKIKKDVLKIGYISSNFNEHPISFLFQDSLKYHDKNRFETYAFHSNNKFDNYTALIKNSVDNFHDITDYSYESSAKLINELGIDILVDLGGHTKDNQLQVLSYHPSPIQCHLLGYAGSTGSSDIQYYITGKNTVPPDIKAGSLFTEKLALTDDWFSTPALSAQEPTKSKTEYGLPEGKFIFGCMNQSYRVTEQCFNDWIDILLKTPDSILWLFSNNGYTIKNLSNIALQRGLEAERLLFTSDFILTETWHHLYIDLYLDTYQLTSGTATFINLSSTKPILSIEGNHSESRVSSSILKSANLDYLIAKNRDDYVNKAVELASNPNKMNEVMNQIKLCKDSNIFNPQSYIKQLETLYNQFWNEFTNEDFSRS